MAVRKFTISTSHELFDAIESLADTREQDRSSLVEMLLREHPLVRDEIERARRRQVAPGLKKGRSIEEIRALARSARRNWEERTSSGTVRIVE